MARITERFDPHFAPSNLACSFCGKLQSQVKLIAGPGILICAECVARCAELALQGDGGVTPDIGATRRGAPICEFCGTNEPVLLQPPSTLSKQALICTRCVVLCQSIIEDHRR